MSEQGALFRAGRLTARAIAFGLVPAVFGAGCTSSFGRTGTTTFLEVSTPEASRGTADKPLPIVFDRSAPIPITVTARGGDGAVDTAYNGYVRISVKPGSVVELTGPGTSGRNVALHNGTAEGVSVSVAGSYGATRIWAEDVGYTPADPVGTKPPQCSDGVDNNGNGLVDFPADPGCAFANDDDENLGSYAAGASAPIFFASPRISDVRGRAQPGAGTPFPHQQVSLNTKDRLIVTRIAPDGFYVTDIDDPGGYSSIFAFNFSPPPLMRVCDRLRGFSGTASDFFGFTEIGFPTWDLDEWIAIDPTHPNPRSGPCLVPEPRVLAAGDIERDPTGAYVTTTTLSAQIAALVRVQSDLDGKLTGKKVDVHIGAHFGPGFPIAPDYAPTDDATNCDLNSDNKVDFNTDPEKTCAAKCQADLECTEYSNFLSRSAFTIVVVSDDGAGNVVGGTIQGNGSSSAQFDPVANRGKPLPAFTGTLRYFSGGSQYTIEARCADDITLDPATLPMPSTRACVLPRQAGDNSSASN